MDGTLVGVSHGVHGYPTQHGFGGRVALIVEPSMLFGVIVTDARVSDLTVPPPTEAVNRYGVDTDALEDFVQDVSDLGAHFHLPFRIYSSGMKARLAFAMSMGIDFDMYLIDEVTSVGDAAFREKSEEILAERLCHRAAVVVSHNLPLLQRMCHSAILLENGRVQCFDCVDEAVDAHRACMATA